MSLKYPLCFDHRCMPSLPSNGSLKIYVREYIFIFQASMGIVTHNVKIKSVYMTRVREDSLKHIARIFSSKEAGFLHEEDSPF